MPTIFSSLIETINYICLPEEVSKESVKEFEGLTSTWVDLPVQLHVIDFKDVFQLHNSFYTPAIQFRKKVESPTRKMVSINPTPDILNQLKSAGVDKALGYVPNINNIKKTKNNDTLTEAKKWLAAALIEASRNALQTTFDSSLKADEKFREIIKNMRPEKFAKVSMVTSVGPVIRATVRLYFERNILESLVRSSMSTQRDLEEELLDSTATELLNLTFTAAKSKLNDERGYQMPGCLPKLITPAEALRDRTGHWRDSRVIPLLTPMGEYYLEIEFHS